MNSDNEEDMDMNDFEEVNNDDNLEEEYNNDDIDNNNDYNNDINNEMENKVDNKDNDKDDVDNNDKENDKDNDIDNDKDEIDNPISLKKKAELHEEYREKRNKNMFDVTNLTYEQYVEKHYAILLEEYQMSQGIPMMNPQFASHMGGAQGFQPRGPPVMNMMGGGFHGSHMVGAGRGGRGRGY